MDISFSWLLLCLTALQTMSKVLTDPFQCYLCATQSFHSYSWSRLLSLNQSHPAKAAVTASCADPFPPDANHTSWKSIKTVNCQRGCIKWIVNDNKNSQLTIRTCEDDAAYASPKLKSTLLRRFENIDGAPSSKPAHQPRVISGQVDMKNKELKRHPWNADEFNECWTFGENEEDIGTSTNLSPTIPELEQSDSGSSKDFAGRKEAIKPSFTVCYCKSKSNPLCNAGGLPTRIAGVIQITISLHILAYFWFSFWETPIPTHWE